jgi:hypothetical protein
MAHKREKKLELRRRYVADGQPLAAAAEFSGVSYSTARNWKRGAAADGDDWDRARLAERVVDGGVGELTRVVLGEFVPMFRSTIEALKGSELDAVEKAEAISRLSDAYTKTVKAAGAVDPAIAKLAWAMEVLKLFAEFVQTQFPEQAVALLEVLEPFGQHLAEQFG